MSTAWFVAACLLMPPFDGTAPADDRATGASQAATASAKPEPKDLPDAVYDAIRRFRRSPISDREPLVPELVALYERVQRDTGLEPKQQQRLLRVLARRLEQAERMLMRRVAREKRAAKSDASERPSRRDEPSAPTVKSASTRPGTLVQQLGAQGQAGGAAGGLGAPQTGQTVANAQELINLIRATICPDTWAASGGNGRIFYYNPLQVLVVTH